jgi:hypothetical protein
MQRKFAAVILMALLPVVAAAVDETPDALVWTYEYLMATSHTERELAPIAARAIEDERVYGELPGHELTDFTAEVLLARFNDPDFPTESKVLLVKVLDAAKSRRYGTVLSRVRDQARDQPVINYARSAARRWIRDHEDEYVPGSVNFRALVADAEAAALKATPVTAQGEHLAQFSGGTIPELFAWAGRPHHVSSLQTRFSDGLIDVKLQHIAFYYRGLGRVVYGFNRLTHEWKFQTVYADPLAFEDEFPYRQRAAGLGLPDTATLEMAQFVSGYPQAMKRVVEINLNRDSPRLEFLDTAAEWLATRFATMTDEQSVDVNGWICRLLSQRGGQRYAALLQHVAIESGERKLQRLARLDIAKAAGVPPEPFRVGSVSIDAQREKYPSPYPGSTFQNHRPH